MSAHKSPTQPFDVTVLVDTQTVIFLIEYSSNMEVDVSIRLVMAKADIKGERVAFLQVLCQEPVFLNV